ncbi:MAG: redoxin domain-containing protein [bacterium]
MHEEQCRLKPGNLIPDFHLASFDGKSIHPSDYRGSKNLIMVFAGDLAQMGPVQQFLAELTMHYAELVQENTEVLAIIQGPVQEADRVKRTRGLPFPVLADEDGHAHLMAGALSSDGGPAMAVYITDRFNEISAVYRTSHGDSIPAIDETFSQLRFIEIQCPE